MRAALAVVILVAACADDRGILIEVKSTDTTVAKLRLFVGTGSSTTSNLTIAGPHRLDHATYYTRDPQDRGDVIELATGPRVVKFAYQTGDDIPLVIAVGYDANNQPVTGGVLHDLVAPRESNHVNAYEIDLDTGAQVSVFGTSGAVQLGLWSSVDATAMDPYTAQCAGIQVGADAPAYFVVNPDDQDCDGYKNGDPVECTPNIYAGSTDADPNHPACLRGDITAGACYIGAQACVDGVGVTATSDCAPTNICLPTSVCNTCASSFSCAADLDGAGHAATSGLHFACSVPANQGQVCETTLRLARPPTAGYGCSDFQIGNTGLGDRLVHGAMEINVVGGKDTSSSSCDAMLEVKGGGATMGVQGFSGLASYTLVNNGGVAIPMELTVIDTMSGCSNAQIDCELVNETADGASNQSQCAGGWGPSLAMTSLGVGMFAGVTLTRDGLRMYYSLGGKLFVTSRASVGQGWGFSTALSNLAPTEIRAPKLSADGTALLFVGLPSGSSGGTRTLFIAPVSSGGAVGSPTPYVDLTGTGRTIESATFTPDPGSLIVEETSMADPTPHLFLVPITATAALGTNVDLPVSPTGHVTYDRQPSLSADGLHLYFASNRDGASAIYVSSRATLADDFTLAVAVKELPASAAAIYPFVTQANDEVYYQRSGTVTSTSIVSRATRATLP